MPSQGSNLIGYLRVLVGAWQNDPRSDAELVARYAETRDETAFATLVGRHGKLVWRTCKHVLSDPRDVEDVFQTTFMALASKAGRFPVTSLAGWLHRVARQAALNADAESHRRRGLEQKLQNIAQPKAESGDRAESYAVLDEELTGLPEWLRVPMILHYLENKTQDEVAKILGCSRTAVRKRLARGEEILRKRLASRGIEAGAVTALLAVGSATVSAVPCRLIESTARAAVAFRSGTLSGVSAEAAEKLLRSVVSKGAPLKSWWLVIACVGSLGIGGASLVVWKMISSDTKSVERSTGSVVTETNAATQTHGEKVDCYGDLLPEGALARIGTIRLRPVKGWPIYSGIAFMPDGKTIVSSNGGFLYFWEWPSGKELRRSKERICGRKIAVSPDGRTLATGGKYWDITANPPQQLKRMRIPAEWTTDTEAGSVAFSSDGKTVAWAIDTPEEEPINHPGSRNIYLVDAATGELKKTLQDELRPGDKLTGGWCLAFSPDNKTLSAGGMSGKITLWDVASGKRRSQIDGNGDPITFLSFLSDGRTLVESRWKIQGKGPTHTTRFLDVATGVEQRLSHVPLASNRVWCKDQFGAKCLSPDGKLLASNSGRVISVWDLATDQEVGPAGGIHYPVDKLLFSPDGKKLVTFEYPFQLWDADTGRLEKEMELAMCNREWGAPFSFFFSDSRHLEMLFDYQIISPATDTRTRRSLRWDVEAGKTHQGEERLPATLSPSRKSFPQSTASSDGRWLAVAFDNDKGIDHQDIVLVDRTTGREVHRFSEQIDHPSSMVFSIDGQSFLDRLTNSPELHVWSTLTGERRMSLNWCIRGSSMRCSAISPDGRWLAVVSQENFAPRRGVVHLWEVASGNEKGKIEISDSHIGNLTWSNDGRLLAGSVHKGDYGEETIYLWDLAAWQEIRRFKGHRSEVRTLMFSPDGLRLASGSQDTTVLIWDLCHLSRSEEIEGVSVPSVNELWTALRKSDATGAWHAMHLLAQHPEVALPLLSERLGQVSRPDSKQVAALLVQLDDDHFEVRKRAGEQLEKIGEAIESTLLEALAKKPSIEVQHGINRVLDTIAPATPSGLRPSQLQAYRGVAVLERIGTTSARQVLEDLSRLPAEMTQAKEAKAALQRLTKSVLISTP